ncbi:MAG: hypothetical protein QM231_00300 [Chloroflexota bacterium]|nr:hypothetical protein [Chloroflexota bacterium]
MDEGTLAEQFLTEEPDIPKEPPLVESENPAQASEHEPGFPAAEPSTVEMSASAAVTVTVVERKVLVVKIDPDQDSDRITRKIQQLHGWLGSHPGEDQFAFRFFDQGNWHEYGFPNESVQITDMLLDQLSRFVEKDSFFIRTERFEVPND